jgi:hypothetical protein
MFAILAAIAAWPALAQEPVGCDKFKWPLDKERGMLAVAKPATPAAAPLANAYTLTLRRDTKLPMAPSRAPKPAANAGFVELAVLPKAGSYRITLSEAGWIDVFQDGTAAKSTAFSSATGCAGLRKSVKFNLSAKPLTVEISGATAPSVSLAITPD